MDMCLYPIFFIPCKNMVHILAYGWIQSRRTPNWSAHNAMFALNTVRCCSTVILPRQRRYFHKSKPTSSIKPRVKPEVQVLIRHREYALLYDYRLKNSLWVYERLTKNSLSSATTAKHKKKFKEDDRVAKAFRCTSKDYSHSGYDKGHLAAAGNHKGNNSNCHNTYYLTNISPKNPSFNQRSWVRLEKYVRKITKVAIRVEVFSGPLFLPQADAKGRRWVKYEVIGKNNIAVPTHFYKILVVSEVKKTKRIEAYILPNQPIPKTKPLKSFQTTLKKVEEAAGIRFFLEKDSDD